MAIPQLTVNLRDLKQVLLELYVVLKGSGRRQSNARLTYHNGNLSVKIKENYVSIPADGYWPGAAYVRAGWLLDRRKLALPYDAILVKLENGRLHISGDSVEARWIHKPLPFLRLHDDITLFEVLLLPHLQPEKELVRAGLMTDIITAEKQAEKMVKSAASILKELGIEEKDLWSLVNTRIKKAVNRKKKKVKTG